MWPANEAASRQLGKPTASWRRPGSGAQISCDLNFIGRISASQKSVQMLFIKLPPGKCHKTLLMISQHWFKYWHGWRQATSNTDQVLWRHTVSIGHNMLIISSYFWHIIANQRWMGGLLMLWCCCFMESGACCKGPTIHIIPPIMHVANNMSDCEYRCEYKSDDKRRNSLRCLDQYMCNVLRLWNSQDRERV